MPTVVQLRGLRNRRAPPEVWQATFAWLGSQRLEPLAPERHVPKPQQRLEARRQLWRPYLEHLRGTSQERPLRKAIQRSARIHHPQRGTARLLRQRPGELRPVLALLHRRREAATAALGPAEFEGI